MSNPVLSAMASACVILLFAGTVATSAATPDVVDSIQSKSLLFETFNDDGWQQRWKHSSDTKYNGRFARMAAKDWTDTGIKMPEKSKFYGLSALLDSPVDPVVASEPQPLPLVVQYEVKYEAGVTCGGAYLKLLSADAGFQPEGLLDSTPYSIMFGPDRCGGPGKVHLILRHRNPVSGVISEKHLASPPAPETNDYTHIYTLRIFPDHKYEILIDGELKSGGSLLEEGKLAPPLLPPAELPDPEDKKPDDWVDAATIPDPHATKPADWDEREQVEDDVAVKPKGWLEDEPHLIDDPAAKRPADWDEEEDGVWEPNQIPNPRCKVGCGPWKRPLKANPNYKGVWKRPMIPNFDYKGPWVQKKIPNPDLYEDAEPLRNGVAPIGAVALELWTVDSGYMFDNILITRDPEAAETALRELWRPRHEAEKKAFEAQLEENKRKEAERAKEEAARKKEERRKARKGGRYDTTLFEQLSAKLLSLFEPGSPLAPLAPALAPLLDWLRDSPEGSVLLVGLVPLALLCLVMLMRLRNGGGGRKARNAAAEAKKTDAVVPDDDDGGADAPAEANADAGTAPVAAAAGAEAEAEPGPSEEAGTAQDGEAPTPAEEGPTAAEDEEEEDAPAGPRRRTRRAA